MNLQLLIEYLLDSIKNVPLMLGNNSNITQPTLQILRQLIIILSQTQESLAKNSLLKCYSLT